jgi:hypothetical protein
LLELCKIGDNVKIILQKIKDLEYLTNITPNIFYLQYRAVFKRSGETMLPDDLDQAMKDLYN